MDVLKDVLKTVGYAIAVVLGLVLAFCLVVVFGYFIGAVLARLPIVGDWLTIGGLLPKSDIPNITAWIALIGALAVQGVGENGGN